VAILALAADPVTQVSATCSIGGPPDQYSASFVRNVYQTQLLLVGVVTDESTMRVGPNTLYKSEVMPEVMLKGDAPDEPLAIPFLGHLGADCSGGPRLKPGERVLLPVYWAYMGNQGDASIEYGWRITGIFGKVLLEGGEATLQWYLGSQPLGDAEAIVRQSGALVAADEAQIDAAVQAALSPPPAQDSNVSPLGTSRADTWRIIAITAIALVVAAIAIAIIRSHRETSTS
jgi:hypothetical protein